MTDTRKPPVVPTEPHLQIYSTVDPHDPTKLHIKMRLPSESEIRVTALATLLHALGEDIDW